MNVSTIGTTKKNTFASILFTILFWLVKRYNKTNKVLNIWPRSEKDILAYGVNYELRGCISRDGRVHIRYGNWSVYIGKPQSIKPAVKSV